MIVFQYGKIKFQAQLVDELEKDDKTDFKFDQNNTLNELKRVLLNHINQTQLKDYEDSEDKPRLLTDPNEIKLILNGKILSQNEQTIHSIFQAYSINPSNLNKPIKFIVMANAEGKQVEEQLQQHRIEEQEYKAKLAKRQKFLHKGNNASRQKGPIIYGFQKITTLSNLPDERRAKEILESLANDSGIIAVMNKYKFTVNELTELMPDGYVGVSDVCVMGLNQNHGQKILLRLRTDDLKGFRKYLSIKKVLYHELAHNIYSEHDGNFYMLMRQIEKDANELKWETSRGWKLDRSAGTSQEDSYYHDDTNGNDDGQEEQTVFTLGGDRPSLSAEAMAREAAILRFHSFQKQQNETKYNQYERNLNHSHLPQQQEEPSSSSSSFGFTSIHQGIDGQSLERLNSQEAVEDNNNDHDDGRMSNSSKEEDQEKDNNQRSKNSKEIQIPSQSIEPENTIVDYISSSSVNPQESAAPESVPMQLEEVIIESTLPTSRVNRIFLERKKEEIQLMFEETIAMILSDETLISTIEKVMNIRDIIISLLDDIINIQDDSNDDMKELKLFQLEELLHLFLKIITNIQLHPGEEKYKRIRKSNKILVKSLKGMETGIQILQQCGFQQEGSPGESGGPGEGEWVYRKNDAGLLYLVKSLLESISNCLKC